MDETQSFRFVDLFAGLGGFHVALRNIGGQAVFAAESDPVLNALYKDNFGIDVWKDMNDLSDANTIRELIPDHEILTAGFPCQPFSKAGEQLGFEHTLQGQLFFRVFEILAEKRPRGFILENVPNILKHRNGETAKIILQKLRDELGYEVEIRRFSPHQFGIPQVRERAYFVGSLTGLNTFNSFDWTSVQKKTKGIASVVLAHVDAERAIPQQTQNAIDMWDDFLARSGSVKLPSFPIWSMEFGADYPYAKETPPALWEECGAAGLTRFHGCFGGSLEDLTQEQQFERIPSHSRRPGDYSFPRWKIRFIRQNRDFYKDNQTWIDPWLTKWKPWLYPSSFQKFEWNAQGEERVIDKHVLQIRASGIRVKRTKTAPSLIAMTHTQVPILGSEVAGVRRYMTPKECAALQSLEDIQLPKKDLQAYKALGNAVNAEVVRAIARPLLVDVGIPVPARYGGN